MPQAKRSLGISHISNIQIKYLVFTTYQSTKIQKYFIFVFYTVQESTNH